MQIKTTMKIPLHTHKDDYNQNNGQQVLLRIWRKKEPSTLLVGMQSAAALEHSLAVPQKIKHRVNIWPRIQLLGI